jgi:hypothetical protein
MCGENLGKNFVQRSSMLVGSVMLWGCVAASGVGNLPFIKGIMNKHVYVKFFENI